MKDIEGFEGKYAVTRDGRVWSYLNERFLALSVNKKRRNEVQVSLGKNRHRKVHRLVAEAFIPNPEAKSDVDHINRAPTDNRVENLRWATRRENLVNSCAKNKRGLPKGVEPHRKKFHARARLLVGGKRSYLGTFDTAAEAKKALDDFQKKNYGGFYLP